MKNDIKIAVENTTIISKKVQKYTTHEKAVWKSAFLNFIVAHPELSQRDFCKSGLCEIARKTFFDSWKKMPKLQELKIDTTKSTAEKLECTEPIVNNFLAPMSQNKCYWTKNATSANRYQPDNEEQAIVYFAKIVCTTGLGLMRESIS